jgi:16S rRNA (guanine966-N2)-methyltransferase
MRVVTGEAKGRKLKTPKTAGTRPIMDRVKTALFDILSTEVKHARFLDLFAGTGSVGIEALSRGAAHATFIEMDYKILQLVRENLQITGLADRAETLHSDAFKFLQTYQVHSKTVETGQAQGTVPTAPVRATVAHADQAGRNVPPTRFRTGASPVPTAAGSVNEQRIYELIYIAPPQYKELAARALALVDSSTLCAGEALVIVQIHPKERPGVAAVECKHFELTDERRYGSTLLMFYRQRSV